MTMIMFNDYNDDDDNYHCYNGNVLLSSFFTPFWKVCQSQTLRNFFMR